MIYKNMIDKDFFKLGKGSNNGRGSLTATAAINMIKSGSDARAIAKTFSASNDPTIGILLHEYMLQHELFNSKYKIKNKSKNKDISQDTCDARIILNKEGRISLETVKGMSKSINEHKTASFWLDNTDSEVASDYKCNVFDIYIKCRMDAYRSYIGVDDNTYHSIIDIKTISSYHMADLKQYIIKNLYHVQAAAYCESIMHNCNTDISKLYYIFIFIESEPCLMENKEFYGIKVVKLSPEMLYEGEELWVSAKERFANSVKADNFQDYPDELIVI